MKDKYNFLRDIGNSSHRPLLLLALEATRGSASPVLEMGMGDGSTHYLHDYCDGERRSLHSFDNNSVWTERFRELESQGHAIVCAPWESDVPSMHEWSVALVDHAPAERRHVDITMLANRAQIIVIHDTEPRSSGYMLDKIWHLFRYRADILVEAPYADAAVVSNFVDVTQWRGIKFDGYPYEVT